MISAKRAKIISLGVIVAALLPAIVFFVFSNTSPNTANRTTPNEQTTSEQEAETPSQENPGQPPAEPSYDIDSPDSLTLVVNKSRGQLPTDYVPSLTVPDVRLRLEPTAEQMQIDRRIAPAVEELFAAASADGVALVFGSGYRSYALQKQFYDSYVARDGQAAADRYSARPGTSEHQTGLAFDATSPTQQCHLEVCFEDLPEGQWLAANAHTYGFIIRYPNGKEAITGYQYEPWHFRYVGPELAQQLFKSNQTMEEFFDLVD